MSTEAKHTPGPWTSRATASLGPQYVVYPEAAGPDVAIVYDHDGCTEANARLLASAPELLEALRQWRSTIGPMSIGERWTTEQALAAYKCMSASRAAIAKAEGK